MSSAPYQPDLLALTRNLQNLHLRFWDQGDAARAIIISAETHQLGDETRIFELMTLGPSFETFFSGRSTIIAREEYKRLIAELSTPSDLHCGVTLLGQPGKSTFMHYFLVERILGGRRTMFQCHQDTIYELNKDGVQVWPATKFSATPSLDWVLVDINESLTTSNINLDDHFVIAAFGPRHEDWWGWYQSRDCELAVMRPWTKHEIVYAGSILIYALWFLLRN
ncbi:hypothetical protein BOTBODRAFT_184483 [Botryobasidium botryosum FD-172 SS1]|uniref:Uncharacterized protein n=1 Tax=Botryobasidium botryosum (strain FD-172 SS1) TaxID=930990 RepID=A0A067MV45_BOTB1|nr:hypothetical protein BOTBODRAFT_184483 [Botryobasidium botryosum FD-172 SS1]